MLFGIGNCLLQRLCIPFRQTQHTNIGWMMCNAFMCILSDCKVPFIRENIANIHILCSGFTSILFDYSIPLRLISDTGCNNDFCRSIWLHEIAVQLPRLSQKALRFKTFN